MSIGSQSQHTSAFPSPLSDSAVSSVLHTPAPTTNPPSFTFKNYSPTASVDDSEHQQQSSSRPALSQSAVQTPSTFEDSLSSSDPLSHSLRTDHLPSQQTSSPVHGRMNSSIKTRIDRLIGFFSSSSPSSRKRAASTDSEGFTEIFTSDASAGSHQQQQQQRCSAEEVGEECVETDSPPPTDQHADSATESTEENSEEATDAAPRGKQFDLLRCYDDAQDDPAGSRDEGRYSASYPRKTGARVRNSNSETGAAQTVLLVKERLQKLVESTSSDERSVSFQSKPVPPRRPTLHTLTSTDSSCTLVPPHHGDREPPGPKPSGAAASRLVIRRVSVCDPPTKPVSSHLSPVALLDQYVAKGELLHSGSVDEIPLTELEGIKWSHFGGCPHTEELAVKQTQVALLHSQLLFERYQCLQHARRNRRLLSRARTATQVAEQLFAMVSGNIHFCSD